MRPDLALGYPPTSTPCNAGPTGKVLLMPEDPNAVYIMVATGTGIAPYRAFWRRQFMEDVPNYKCAAVVSCWSLGEGHFEGMLLTGRCRASRMVLADVCLLRRC